MALGQQERAQRTPLGIELVGSVPQAEEDLLDDLLGQGPVDQKPPGEGEDRPGVAAVGLGQRFLAVAADGHHEDGVAGVADLVARHR